MRNDDHEDEGIKLEKKGMEGIESQGAERDYFIIQDKLRRAVEERKRAAKRGRETGKRRLKSFITYVVVSVVSIALFLFLFFLKKLF
jgi:hypothetical protein